MLGFTLLQSPRHVIYAMRDEKNSAYEDYFVRTEDAGEEKRQQKVRY